METIEIFKGDTVDLNFQLLINEYPLPLNGGDVYFAAKKRMKDKDYVIEPRACDVTDDPLGKVRISLDSVDTNRDDTIICELEYRNINKKITVWQGNLSFAETVMDPSEVKAIDILNAPEGFTTNKNISVVITGLNVVEYKFSLDGSAWSDAIDSDTTIDIGNLTLGPHSLKILARNADETFKPELEAEVFDWTIVQTEANISPLPELLTDVKNYSFVITGTDLESYKYKINSGAWSDEIIISQLLELSLDAGLQTLELIGKDKFGAWQASPTTTTWEIV